MLVAFCINIIAWPIISDVASFCLDIGITDVMAGNRFVGVCIDA